MARVAKNTGQVPVPPAFIWGNSALVRRQRANRAICRTAKPTLLWVDDFEPGLAMYKEMFERLGFRVLTAPSGHVAIRLAALNRIDAVVTDYEMPGMNGEAVAHAIKSLDAHIPVVLFSGSTLVSKRTYRMVDACCDKAGSRDDLLTTLHRLLHNKQPRTLQPPPVAKASHQGHRTIA